MNNPDWFAARRCQLNTITDPAIMCTHRWTHTVVYEYATVAVCDWHFTPLLQWLRAEKIPVKELRSPLANIVKSDAK